MYSSYITSATAACIMIVFFVIGF